MASAEVAIYHSMPPITDYDHVFDFTSPKALSGGANTERSPQDSPVTLKKKLRRFSPQYLVGLDSSKSHINLLSTKDIVGAASGAMLKSNYPDAPFVGQKKILKRTSSTRTRSASKRHIQFQENVTVYVFDESGANVCTRCEALLRIDGPRSPLYESMRKPRSCRRSSRNTQISYIAYDSENEELSPDLYTDSYHSALKSLHSDRRSRSPSPNGRARSSSALNDKQSLSDITHRSNVRSLEQDILKSNTESQNVPKKFPVPSIPDEKPSEMSRVASAPAKISTPRSQSIGDEGKINISFIPSSSEGTRLKFVVHLGVEYDPNNIVVKACTNGSKVRVQATKRSEGDYDEVHQFNERYTLPMAVDPYSVEARLDSNGYLTIQAILLTSENNTVLKWTSENMSHASHV